MTLILSGTDGLSDVDGTAATPAIRGTDANTGIFFPAADTIAFAEGGAEAMRIDSSGNVGIGTATPTAKLTVNNATATDYLSLTTAGSTKGVLADEAGDLIIKSAASLLFQTNGAIRARLNTTGAFVLAGGTTTADGIGITFPATQSGSSDANTLDDYEEGTWTPSTSGNGNITSVSITDGRYTKIGKLVTISASVTGSITATGTETNINITLPFNAYTSSWNAGGTWFGYAGSGPNRFATGLAFNGSGSATNVVFYIAGVNVNTTGTLASMISFTYIASA